MKNEIHSALLILGALLAGAAHAQVYKCPDPANNRITYSDAPCTGGRRLESRRTQAEIMAERQQAAYELQRSQAQHQRIEALQNRAPQQPSQARQASSSCPSELEIKNLETAASSIIGSEAEKKMKRQALLQARACATGGSTAEADPDPPRHRERASTSSTPQPTQLTNCDPAGCWDTTGTRYNRAAGGNFFRSDGKFCTGAGAQLICH